MMKLTGRCSACKQIVTQDDSVSHWRSEETGVLCLSAPELPNSGRYHIAEPLDSNYPSAKENA